MRPRSWVLALLLLLCGSSGARAAPQYTIGAWYFTLWHPDAASGQLDAAARLYGRRDPWGGVRDYAAGHGATPILDPATGKAVDYGEREPQAGFYDLSDPQVVDTQLAEGAHAGLSFFAFYFYIDGATGRPMPISNVVRKFYDAPNHHGMSLLLAPIVNPNGGPKLTLQNFRSNLLPVLTDYLSSPAALRVDGRPVLVDWWLAPRSPATDYAVMYTELRRAVRARTGRDPFIVKMLDADAAAPDIADSIGRMHEDALTCFVFPMTPAEDYASWAASYPRRMHAQLAGDMGRVPYWPCAGTGQDARPWYRVGWGGKPMQQRGYTVGISPAAFHTALVGLRAFMDSGVDPMRVAILYAWNEWGEAEASIEPSKIGGGAYAGEVRQTFGLTSRP